MDEYSLRYEYTTTAAPVDPSILGGLVLGGVILGLVVYVVAAIFLSKIFKKLGTEPSWAAWVPLYNNWKFFEAGGQQGWWMFIPVAGAIFQIIAAYHIGLRLGKSGGWVALYLFVSPIWLILLAVGETQDTNNPQQMSAANAYPQQPTFGPAQPVQPMQQVYPQQPAMPPQQPQPMAPVQPQQPVQAPQFPQQPTDQPPQA